MNNLLKNFLLLIPIAWVLAADAGVKVTGLNWANEGGRGRFVVATAGGEATPDWSVRGNRLAVSIPGAALDAKIERYVNGIRLAASSVPGGVLATLTFIHGGAIARNDVFMTLESGRIEVATRVPNGAPTAATTIAPTSSAKAATPVKNTRKKEDLDESFLAQLERDEAPTPPAAFVATTAKTVAPKVAGTTVTKKIPFRDEIRAVQAAPKRSDGFSIAGYAGKFLAFLGIVLLFFWGAVQLMKKGFLSKGKLGFLNGSSLVSVLSTTYVGPKRQLLLVKAHHQVFLVAASEAGFEFLSEVRDVPGLVKEGEKHITGTNFDDDARSAEAAPATVVKLKEDIYQSAPVEEKSSPAKDIARFSDELKKKVKNLKALQ